MAIKNIFGDVPMIRVLDFMLDHIETDYTVKEIVKHADVVTGAVKRDLPLLIECGMVVETRKIGGVQLYALNMNNSITAALINFDDTIAIIMTEEQDYQQEVYAQIEHENKEPDED